MLQLLNHTAEHLARPYREQQLGYVMEPSRQPFYVDASAARWAVALDLCGVEEVAFELPLDGGAPVLVVPELGLVEVHVVDGAGKTVTGPTDVAICPANLIPSPIRPGWLDAGMVGRFPTGQVRTSRSGVVRFDHVPVGQRLVAMTMRDQEEAIRSSAVLFQGPRESAATVRVEVVRGPAPLVLTGRVLESNGEPARRASFVLGLYGEYTYEDLIPSPEPWQTVFVRTDRSGAFVVEMESGGDVPPLPVVVLERRPRGATAAGGRFTLGQSRRGRVDLGTMRLSPAPLLASGIVVDGDGRPVSGASVCVVPSRDWTRYRRTTGRPSCTTGDRGEFDLRSFVPHPPMTLMTRMEGFDDAYRERVPMGGRDLELRLKRHGD